jgi:hypothetical protein
LVTSQALSLVHVLILGILFRLLVILDHVLLLGSLLVVGSLLDSICIIADLRLSARSISIVISAAATFSRQRALSQSSVVVQAAFFLISLDEVVHSHIDVHFVVLM